MQPQLTTISIDSHTISAVILNKDTPLIVVHVPGMIGNSVTDTPKGRERTKQWKYAVAAAIREKRGSQLWKPAWTYAISLGLSFHPKSHGGQKLDIENYVKPLLDAIAAGLFYAQTDDITHIVRFNEDDSNFAYLFVYRLEDGTASADEHAIICINYQAKAES